MQCPNCGNPATENDAFCGVCGAALTPAAQPTTPMPAQPQALAAGASPTAPPARKRPNTALIVTLVVVGVIVVIGIAVGGFFVWRSLGADEAPVAKKTTGGEASTTITPENTEDSSAQSQPSGFATPEEALADSLPADWVSLATTEEADRIVYAIGPPASEYVEMVEVVRQSDGSWLAGEPYPIEGDDMGGETMAPEDEALQVVGEFIYAVQEDRADDAHALTVSPFAEDPASAQYSNGELETFEITDAQMQSDGSTVWVWSSEQWAWGTENYIYVCIPTTDGYRISELRIP